MMNPIFKDQFHAEIFPVPEGTNRPLWSVLIPTHNCAHYLKETLQSVLSQDPGEDQMEIIVIDDYSTADDPEAIVKEIGQGRVEFIRQPKNVGKVRNYETGLKRSKGIYIHQLHGDDKVLNGFYEEIEKIFEQNQTVLAAFTRTIYIDEQGRWTGITGLIQEKEGIVLDILERLYVKQCIQTPSMVVKRQAYEYLGGFDRRLNCLEDWEMWNRIATFFPVASSNKVLANYRTHDRNATNLTLNDGSAIKVHRLVLQIIDSFSKESKKNLLQKKRRKAQSEFLLMSALQGKNNLDIRQKYKLIIRGISLNFTIKNLIFSIKILI